MDRKRFTIPHVIFEFDDSMLVPLSRNFSDIESSIIRLQIENDQLINSVNELTQAHNSLVEQVEIILAALSTEST